MQGDIGIAMGVQEVVSALKAGQDAGRLTHLSPGTNVDAVVKALTLDGLGVSKPFGAKQSLLKCHQQDLDCRDLLHVANFPWALL